ncbi:cation transport ATPase [Microbacterium halimionae]|uniref:Cation transport ATPase n=1 Tax=Microbacterium halimionae TaxID=1526413 RepID=A0A7W3JQU5_9MICO|nr:cation transport ATPase [Microbacterium halimionae]NII94653.1 cation transport ATPase [Microbacterium halimionae]
MVLAALGFIPALVGAWLQEGVDVVAIAWALRATRPGSPQ